VAGAAGGSTFTVPVTLAGGLVMPVLSMPFALPALQPLLEHGIALLLR